MLDNSDFASKIAIRHKSLQKLSRKPSLVLDAFAGEGVIAEMLWSVVADEVICIEKERSKAEKITAAKVIIGDNRDYIHLADDACLIDCDAYGLVMPYIKLLPKNKLVVFTDGTAYAKQRNASLGFYFERDLRAVFSEYEYVLSAGKTAYYGWGITK